MHTACCSGRVSCNTRPLPRKHVCVCVDVAIKVWHFVNLNANTNAQNGSEPILDVLHWHNVKCWRKRKYQVWTDLEITFWLQVRGPSRSRLASSHRPGTEFCAENDCAPCRAATRSAGGTLSACRGRCCRTSYIRSTYHRSLLVRYYLSLLTLGKILPIIAHSG